MTERDETDTPTDEKLLSISKEKSNFARISLLLNSIAPKAVRRYFDRRFKPTKLKELIHKNYSILKKLRSKNILTQSQWNLLFPSTGEPSSGLFDITLLMCLLRNIMGVVEPRTGWDNKPLEEDTRVGADLTRIRYYRNMLAHSESGEVDDTDFEKVWKDLSKAIGRLGGGKLEKDCNILKIKPLDKIEHENILNLIKQELVTWHLRNQTLVETVAAKSIIKQSLGFRQIFRNYRIEREATLQHLTLSLQDKRYVVVPVTTRDEIIQFYNPYHPTVFVCDDFFGTSSSNKNRFQSWKDKTPKIKVIFNSENTKIIVTGRSQIYKDVRMKRLYFHSLCVCNFSSNESPLTDSEKFEKAKKYTKYSAESVPQVSNKYDFCPLLCNTYSRSPLLCNTYSRNVPVSIFYEIFLLILNVISIPISCLFGIYFLDLMQLVLQAMFEYIIPAMQYVFMIYLKFFIIIIIAFLIISGILSTIYLMNYIYMHLDIYPPLVPAFAPRRDRRRYFKCYFN